MCQKEKLFVTTWTVRLQVVFYDRLESKIRLNITSELNIFIYSGFNQSPINTGSNLAR